MKSKLLLTFVIFTSSIMASPCVKQDKDYDEKKCKRLYILRNSVQNKDVNSTIINESKQEILEIIKWKKKYNRIFPRIIIPMPRPTPKPNELNLDIQGINLSNGG